MRRILTLTLAVLGPASLLGGSGVAAPEGMVILGNTTCFRIRVPDGSKTIQQRVDHIQDVVARYLGSSAARFTVRPIRDRRHIDLNGEFLLAVTPEDAKATGYKTAEALAKVWVPKLRMAFQESSARPTR